MDYLCWLLDPISVKGTAAVNWAKIGAVAFLHNHRCTAVVHKISSISKNRKEFWMKKNIIMKLGSTLWWETVYEQRLLIFMGGRHSSVVSSAPTILLPRVWIPSTPSTLFQFVIDLWCEKDENKWKRGRDWPIFKKTRTKPKINDGLVVVAQLTTWSLLIPEDPGLNPQCVVNLGVLFWTYVTCYTTFSYNTCSNKLTVGMSKLKSCT